MLKKLFLLPGAVAILSGILSAGLFIYFVLEALSPGPLATVAIILTGLLFGIFVATGIGAVTAVAQLKNAIARMSQRTCSACAEKLPENAAFCPFCGCRTDLTVPLILKGF